MSLTRARALAGKTIRKLPAAGVVVAGPLPLLAAVRHRNDSPPPATLASVYRRQNARHVTRLVRAALETGLKVSLWALDQVVPELADVTLGSGPGSRFGLLNQLADAADPGWLVIVDDDVEFVAPSPFRTLLAVAQAQGFDISQPAQVRGSFRNHLITQQRLLASARETTFVEVGPVVAFSPRARELAVPFPDVGMGWGVELEWAALRKRGIRLGVVDCVPLLHLAPTSAGYDWQAELLLLEERVKEHGFSSFVEAQQTLNVYRVA